MLPGLHQEVHHAAVAAVQREAAVAGRVPPHDAHVRADALQVHERLRRDLLPGQVLPRHLHVHEGLLLRVHAARPASANGRLGTQRDDHPEGPMLLACFEACGTLLVDLDAEPVQHSRDNWHRGITAQQHGAPLSAGEACAC